MKCRLERCGKIWAGFLRLSWSRSGRRLQGCFQFLNSARDIFLGRPEPIPHHLDRLIDGLRHLRYFLFWCHDGLLMIIGRYGQ